jgi:hypothetical protein
MAIIRHQKIKSLFLARLKLLILLPIPCPSFPASRSLSLAAAAVKCVSDSALPPVLHFLTNFQNRLRQHLAFSISLCLKLLFPELRFFFNFFQKEKESSEIGICFLSWRFFGVVVCVFSFFLYFLDVCCLCVRYNVDPFYLRRMYLTRQSFVVLSCSFLVVKY